MRNNPIEASIDFDKEGVQHGFLKLPHSRDDSAWGAIMTPITQFNNGNGPTALLTGANHGDEYEGPVTLFNFARNAQLSDIKGRVIVIPAMNYPAFQAASRVSPIDGANLNRVFPGRPDGGVTEILADYFSRTLLPMADFVLDIHSGGKTLKFIPFAASHILENKDQEARCESALKAFSAPYSLKMLEIDARGMYDSQAEKMGKVFVSTELGGGGSTTPKSLAIAKRGVENFLIHAGILKGEISPCSDGSIRLNMPDNECFVFCQHTGLIEPCVTLGETVLKNDLVARIHNTERTAMPPHDYFAPLSGIVIARHVPSLAKMGDTLFVIAEKEA